MTKILEINSCEECPLSMALICTHEKTDGALIEDLNKIPQWCPLKDKGGINE